MDQALRDKLTELGWCSCVEMPNSPEERQHVYDDPNRVILDFGRFTARRDCDRCHGVGQVAVSSAGARIFAQRYLKFLMSPSVILPDPHCALCNKDHAPCANIAEAKRKNLQEAWDKQRGSIYPLTPTRVRFDPDNFATVAVTTQPEPHVCVYCKRPVQQGHCGCV